MYFDESEFEGLLFIVARGTIVSTNEDLDFSNAYLEEGDGLTLENIMLNITNSISLTNSDFKNSFVMSEAF